MIITISLFGIMHISKRLGNAAFISITVIVVLALLWFLVDRKADLPPSPDMSMLQEPLNLVLNGQGRCVIVCGTPDEYAGKRLQRWFSEEAKTHIPMVAAEKLPLNSTVVILLGSSASNPFLQRMAEEARINIDSGGLTDQGYVIHTCHYKGRDWLMLAGGGRTGTIYAVSDLINWRLNHNGADVSLAPVHAREIPKFKYRWFWNWDNRMEWGGEGEIASTMASVRGGAAYRKKPEAFLEDTKRCVDYMADHKFNGMILWGFLRDSHGGVAAARELCRYAEERGVRILPGIGTSGYEGFYYEGEHKYNTDSWLKTHPGLRAVDENGAFYNALCPSKKANQDWLDNGIRWMFETFHIGGVNLEMGDFLVCHCDDCRRARKEIDSDEPDYYKDMAISHSITLESAHQLKPDAWLSYATYTGYTAEMMQDPPKFLEMIPQDALCQWTLTGMAGNWPAGIKPMAKHNLGYLHWCNFSTHTADDFYFEEIRNICWHAAKAGFEGLDTYGELNPERLNVELFYLAWEAFLWDPEMTPERFVDERLGRLYGGTNPARKLLQILPLIRTAGERENAENLSRARALATSAFEEAGVEGISRWEKLLAYLEKFNQ